jgi:hypothetical protein
LHAEINLINNNLRGSPALVDWSAFPALIQVNFQGNALTGQIPAGLVAAQSLQVLILNSNDFSGPLPPELGALSKLHTMHVISCNVSNPLRLPRIAICSCVFA